MGSRVLGVYYPGSSAALLCCHGGQDCNPDDGDAGDGDDGGVGGALVLADSEGQCVRPRMTHKEMERGRGSRRWKRSSGSRAAGPAGARIS